MERPNSTSAPTVFEAPASEVQAVQRFQRALRFKLSKTALSVLFAVRATVLEICEPIDFLSRCINGKRNLPPLRLRRYVGPLATTETSGAEFTAYLKLLCGASSGSRVLDVGCGFGLLALYLQDTISPPGRYVGLDLSKSAIRWARRSIGLKHPQFQFLHLDIRNEAYNRGGKLDAANVALPFPDKSFDIAVLKSVFTHMRPAEMKNYIEQLARVLELRGTCLCTLFLLNETQEDLSRRRLSRLYFHFGSERWRYAYREMPELAVAYSEEAFRGMVRDVGLTVKSIHYGSWSGRRDTLSYQDIVVIGRGD